MFIHILQLITKKKNKEINNKISKNLNEKLTFEGFEHFTTKSDYNTTSKSMKSPSFLCCIKCSPSLFTWDRTHYFRQFLRYF